MADTYIIAVHDSYVDNLGEALGPFKTQKEAEAALQTLLGEGLDEESAEIRKLMSPADYSDQYLLEECAECTNRVLPGLVDINGFCEDCAKDSCPSCGCMSGEGLTKGCKDPLGCGDWQDGPETCSCTMNVIMATGCKCGGS